MRNCAEFFKITSNTQDVCSAFNFKITFIICHFPILTWMYLIFSIFSKIFQIKALSVSWNQMNYYYSRYKKNSVRFFTYRAFLNPNWTLIHIEIFLLNLQYMQLLLQSMRPLTKRIPKKPWRPFGTPLLCWWIWLRTFLTITRLLCMRQKWPNLKSLETR